VFEPYVEEGKPDCYNVYGEADGKSDAENNKWDLGELGLNSDDDEGARVEVPAEQMQKVGWWIEPIASRASAHMHTKRETVVDQNPHLQHMGNMWCAPPSTLKEVEGIYDERMLAFRATVAPHCKEQERLTELARDKRAAKVGETTVERKLMCAHNVPLGRMTLLQKAIHKAAYEAERNGYNVCATGIRRITMDPGGGMETWT